MQQQPTTQKKVGFSLTRHAASGAMMASLIGALFVLHYLLDTVFGLRYAGHTLIEYIAGTAHNLEEFGAEALFVVITRFLLAFGLCWGPITIGLSLLAWAIGKVRK